MKSYSTTIILYLFLFFWILQFLGISIHTSGQSYYFNKRECFISFQQENHSNGILATDTGYIVAGISVGAYYGYDRINLAFYDLTGAKKKVSSFFGNTGYLYNLGYTGCILNTYDNNLVMCGFRKDTTPYTKDEALLIKINSNFDTIWTKVFTDSAVNPYHHYYLYQCKETSDSGLIMTGIKMPHGENTDILLIKTDKNGNLIWERTYGQGGNYYEYGYSIIETLEGYLLGGFYNIWGNFESGDPIIYKLKANGEIQWQKNLGGPYEDGWALVTKAPDNHYVVGTDIADSMAWPHWVCSKINIIKLDTGGNIIWSKKYGPSVDRNKIASIHVNDDGTIITTGNLLISGSQYFGWILKVNQFGDSLWMRYYQNLIQTFSQNYIYDFA
jgi:hypothetical protein